MQEQEWGYDDKKIPTWDELNGINPQNTISRVFPDEAPMTVNARIPSQLRLIEDESVSLTQEMMEAWSPPDPGMHQRKYNDSELEGETNFDETRDEQSPPRNLFIDDEATEVSDDQLEGEEEDESDTNDCVIVETLTEDEANAIEDWEYLIDLIIGSVTMNSSNGSKERKEDGLSATARANETLVLSFSSS